MSNAKKAPVKKKTNGYKMPDPLPAGEVLQDIYKKQWILGPSIGKGGFGEIYSAKQANSPSKDYKYVIKIEPHENGPLFVEMHFYTRCAREKDVTAFKQQKKLKHLGMPIYIASGSHTYKNEKYRFILMERFAPKDVWKLFVENGRSLPAITVYRLALQMLDSLEYIHSMGYIHGDIKGANILLSEQNANHAFLVDFGLAGKFTTDAQYVPNPKRMHNGTIEYLSRDAHQGVQTRRGDIEILAFNIIHWLTGVLPWEGNTNQKSVQEKKENHMENIQQFSVCFDNGLPNHIAELLSYIYSIKHDQAPDYAKIKKILLKGLKNAGGTESSPLEFSSTHKRKSATLESTAILPKRAKPSGKTNRKKKDGKKDESSDDELNGNDVPSGSMMNAEELRITELKRAKTAVKSSVPRKPKAKLLSLDESSDDDEGNENKAPTSSMMNPEELRIVAMKADKRTVKNEVTKNVSEDANGSPPRITAKSSILYDEVRRSPRNRNKRVDYVNY